jgi:hypothetical protein
MSRCARLTTDAAASCGATAYVERALAAFGHRVQQHPVIVDVVVPADPKILSRARRDP